MKSRGTPWLRLKVLVAAVLLTMLPLDRSSAEIGNAQAPATGDYRDERILAKPKSTANENELQNLHSQHKGKVARQFERFGGLQVIEFEKGSDIKKTIQEYRQSGLFEYIEPDYLVHTLVLPNDPFFTNQWGLYNTGQSGGTPHADIDAPEGWDIQNTATNVIVATTDTGARLDHEDLVGNFWVNPGEIPGDGIDNDNDGYIDDVNGINTVANNGNPNDDAYVGHGTHVAGIIGAHGNNALGVSGVAWQVKLMPLKFLNAYGSGSLSDAITCFNYAIAKGAKIINASWGGGPYSQAMYDAINSLRTNGVILVVAAGNGARDNDFIFTFPASYTLDNIVTVDATTRSNTLAYFSNHGYLSTHLGAPGYEIQSTYNSNSSSYAILSGTSMAAPHVSGALALLRQRQPSDYYLTLIYRLLGNVQVLPALQGNCLSGGMLNLHTLLNSTTLTSPANDNFTNRIQMTGPKWTTYGLNLNGSKEPGEPNHAGNAGGASVWWTWTAPFSGLVEVTTANSIQSTGAVFNTLLAVYTGSAVNSLTAVASNDDGNIVADGATTSRLSFVATSGTTYQIAVDGYNGATGFIKLAVAYSPKNDSLASAFKLSGDYVAWDGWNLGATKESGEPNHAGNAGGRSIWWSWKPPIAGTFVLTTEGSSFDTLLAVYTGSSYPLTLVASNDNDPDVNLKDDYGGKTSAVTFTATEGQTYQIAVDGYNGSFGHVVLAGGYAMTMRTPALVQGGSTANNLSERNYVVGSFAPTSGVTHAFYYNNGQDTFTDLGALPGWNFSEAFDANNSGQVVGKTATNSDVAYPGHAFLWDNVNGMQRLDSSTNASKALAINNAGQAAGFVNSQLCGGANWWRACYWTNGGIVQLSYSGDACTVYDIDDLGDMVGYGYVLDHNAIQCNRVIQSDGLLWHNVLGSLASVTLPTLGGTITRAWSVNNGGQVVGSSAGHGTRWQETKPQDLGSIGSDGSACYGNNNNGQIVGQIFTAKLASAPPPIYFNDSGARAALWQNGAFLCLDRLKPSNSGWVFLSSAQSINDGGLLVGSGDFRNGTWWDVGTAYAFEPMNVIRMASPALATNNLLSFTVTGPAGLSCTVQGSTDLVAGAWTNLGSITLSGGSAQFTDVNSASFSQRFYRVSSGSKLSDNVAGFLVRSGPSGQLLVANPFNCADNRAPALFPNLVDGSILWKFDVASQYYRNANTYYAGYGWGDPEMTLNPGEGVIVQSTSAYTMRWVGFVPQNCLSASIPALGSINSSLTAVGGQVDTALGFPVANGDWIARMTDTQGNWTTYTNQNATWSPSAPTVSLGEAFYSYKGSAFVWRQNLSVW